MRVPLPPQVVRAISILERAGYEAYVVGGAVRDYLLGLTPSDYDIATNAKPEEIMRLFRDTGWVVVPKGIEYGVVSVIDPQTGYEIEIATFRREIYNEPYNRKSARVEYARSLEEDLARRDFTFNALAYSPTHGIVDLYNGRRDLQEKIVRFIGEPGERIIEDPLRMLRALRFALKLGGRIEPGALEAIREHADKLSHVSGERIGYELMKALSYPTSYKLPSLLYETNLCKVVLPELADMKRTRHSNWGSHYGEDVLQHTEDVLQRIIPLTNNVQLRAAALLHDTGKPYTVVREGEKIKFPGHEKVSAEIAEKRMRAWRRPASEVEFVKTIAREHMRPLHMSNNLRGERLAQKLIAKYGELAEPLAIHALADSGQKEVWEPVLETIRKMRNKPKPLVTGKDIIALGVKPGPQIRELKELAYEFQLQGLSKEEILSRLKKIINENQ